MSRKLQPEKAVQAQVVALLRLVAGHDAVFVQGGHRRRGDHQSTMQTPGIPDLHAFVPRQRFDAAQLLGLSRELVYVECKAPGGRLRPEQQVYRELCRRAGIAHIVGGLDDVIAWLADRGLVKPESFPHYRQAAIAAKREVPA